MYFLIIFLVNLWQPLKASTDESVSSFVAILFPLFTLLLLRADVSVTSGHVTVSFTSRPVSRSEKNSAIAGEFRQIKIENGI